MKNMILRCGPMATLLSLATLGSAQYNILNNLIGPPSGLVSRPNFSSIQVSNTWDPTFNSTVVQDFTVGLGGATVNKLGFAWEGMNGDTTLAASSVTGAQIAVWLDLTSAGNSGTSLTGNSILVFQASLTDLNNTMLPGTGSNTGQAVLTEITGFSFGLNPGTYWIGASVHLDSNIEYAGILSNQNGTGNSHGINPGGGWGQGSITPGDLPVAAAYGIGGEVAPEPCTALLLLPTAWLINRRRRPVR